jgi:hypothetical protein
MRDRSVREVGRFPGSAGRPVRRVDRGSAPRGFLNERKDTRGKKGSVHSRRIFSITRSRSCARWSGSARKVFFYDERPSNSVFTKTMIRLNRRFLHLSINAIRAHDEEMNGRSVDYIHIIKGETMSSSLLVKR